MRQLWVGSWMAPGWGLVAGKNKPWLEAWSFRPTSFSWAGRKAEDGVDDLALGFPGGACGKEPGSNARDIKDAGSIPGSGRFPGVGNGHTLQYSSLENPMDRGAWQATVHGVSKSQTWLSEFIFLLFFWKKKDNWMDMDVRRHGWIWLLLEPLTLFPL